MKTITQSARDWLAPRLRWDGSYQFDGRSFCHGVITAGAGYAWGPVAGCAAFLGVIVYSYLAAKHVPSIVLWPPPVADQESARERFHV